MVFKFFTKNSHKIATIILVSAAVLVSILGLLVNLYWSPILSSKVKEVVLKSSNGLYAVNFASAELHVLRGTIDIFNITLKPDTAVYNREKKQNLAPNNLVELHVKRLTLSHIHPFKLYFQHKLEIGEVVLDEPVLSVSYQLNHKKDTIEKARKTAWQKISKSLHSIHIGTILLGDVKLKYEDYSGNKLVISELKEMDLSAHDMLIDSVSQTDPSRLLYCRDIIAELNNYTGKTPSGLYTYKFGHLKLSTLQSRLNIEGLTLRPIKTDAFFAKTSNDKFTVRLDSVQLNHFDFLNYHKYRMFAASSLIVNSGHIEVFSNPKTIIQTTDRVATFPNAGLRKINADLQIDTVSLHRVNVFYSEYNRKSGKTGYISFNNTSGRFFNITTRPAVLQKNNTCAVNLSTYFMNRGKLNISFTFNLSDEKSSFTYKGSLGAMDLKAVNPATMPLAMVKINSGTIKQFNFDIKANRLKSEGKVLVLYSKLKVSLLKQDTMLGGLQSKPIASLFANIFILKHDNPDAEGGIPRSFYVNYYRESKTPFFKFAWQTLLTGIKPAIGLNKQVQDETMALVNQHEINKQKRLLKKQQRQQRRAARQKKRRAKK